MGLEVSLKWVLKAPFHWPGCTFELVDWVVGQAQPLCVPMKVPRPQPYPGAPVQGGHQFLLWSTQGPSAQGRDLPVPPSKYPGERKQLLGTGSMAFSPEELLVTM